jgi:hypothetical protein
MVLIAKYQAPKVLKPGERALYLTASLVATKLVAVLGAWPAPLLAAVRCYQLNAALIEKPLIKLIAVIGLIASKPIGSIRGKTAVMGRLHQLYFMGEKRFLR